MSKEIRSKIIGQLKQDENFSDWWRSGLIKIPFLDNNELPIIFMDFNPKEDTMFLDEADKALVNFFKLSTEYKNIISELVYKNRIDFLDYSGLNDENNLFRQIKDKNEIWNYVHPTEIYITRRTYKDQDVYFQISCDCDWEKEHGLQLVFRQGKKLTRISEQDGHLTEADAYN